MTRIKFCGLTRREDIRYANACQPDYIGFVFAPQSRRYVTPEHAYELKKMLNPAIKAAGVFVKESPETIAALLNNGTIDLAQLHGEENPADIRILRSLTPKPLLQAYCIRSEADVRRAAQSLADMVLLDGGSGEGILFDWNLIKEFGRPFFLAGGLNADNVSQAVSSLHPYAVDVSSGIETDGYKDAAKMYRFIRTVRGEDEKI